MLQEFFRCRKTQLAVAPANSSALIGVEKPVDFRLADWLPKGDARQHFKGRRCHLKISLAPLCSLT
jgi:hypothetical protein